MSQSDGETSEEEIARLSSDLVSFFRALSPEATRAYADLAAIDRELGERVDGEDRATKGDVK